MMDVLFIWCGIEIFPYKFRLKRHLLIFSGPNMVLTSSSFVVISISSNSGTSYLLEIGRSWNSLRWSNFPTVGKSWNASPEVHVARFIFSSAHLFKMMLMQVPLRQSYHISWEPTVECLQPLNICKLCMDLTTQW